MAERVLATPLAGLKVLEFSHTVPREAGFGSEEIAALAENGVIAAKRAEG